MDSHSEASKDDLFDDSSSTIKPEESKTTNSVPAIDSPDLFQDQTDVGDASQNALSPALMQDSSGSSAESWIEEECTYTMRYSPSKGHFICSGSDKSKITSFCECDSNENLDESAMLSDASGDFPQKDENEAEKNNKE